MIVRVLRKDGKGRRRRHRAVYKLNGLVKGRRYLSFAENTVVAENGRQTRLSSRLFCFRLTPR